VWSLSLFSYSEFSDFALSRYSITTLVLLLVSLLFFVFPVTGSNWICSKHNTARTSPSKVSRSPVDHSTLPSAPYQAPTQGPRSLRVLMVQVDTVPPPLVVVRLQPRCVRTFDDRRRSWKDLTLLFGTDGRCASLSKRLESGRLRNQTRGKIASTWYLNHRNFPTEMQHMVGPLSSIRLCS
jgi:hypothetical protein